VVIDCTGDADVTALAGFATELGRPEDGLTQPVTLCFHVSGVDPDALPPGAEMTAAYRQARDRGEVDCPREDVLMFPTADQDRFMFNTTRVTGVNGADSLDLTRAEIVGRRQAEAIFGVLRKRFAAFRDAYLVRMATQIGVRETRRIVGDYTLTQDDVLSCARFPDAVACCSYPVDIHNPGGEGTTLIPVRGDYYEIPYRCTLPHGAENLLVAGRPISCDHGAHSSLRIMPTCVALGEAAGVAAAMAAARGVSPAAVPAEDLRAELIRRGAFVGDAAAGDAKG
jgi:hypothetical protein